MTLLYLEDRLLIGRGTERYCYRHPHDSKLCVKTTHNFKNYKRQNIQDYLYFKKLERRNINWSHLPRCHGWVKTNQGDGLVFDLLQDETGRPLKSLRELSRSGELTSEDIEPSLEILRNYLLDNSIFTSDLRDSNIVCGLSQGEPPHLYIIDGIGDRDFIKLASRFPPLARMKTRRQWDKFIRRMKR